MIPTNSPLLAALSPYTPTDVHTGTNITFSFLGSGVTVEAGDTSADDTPSLTWTTTQKNYVRDIFTYISTLVNLTFTETAVGSTVNIEFAQISSFTDPSTTGVSVPKAPQISQIIIPTEYADLDDVTLIHEIGHSIGMSHPFDGPNKLPGVDVDGDLGTFNMNTELATRMSYNPGASNAHPGLDITGEPSAYGALDIAALQLLYGANTSTGAGDTVYGDNPTLITIWDNGGNDTIDYSGATDNTVIDLRAATLELEAGGGGYLSYIGRSDGTVANGGYTIAFGVEVENAKGGSGNDNLTGNAFANFLTGGAGDDMIDGGAGIDTGIYSGNQNSYSLMLSAAGTTLSDRSGNGNGTDTLANLEFLSFDTGVQGNTFDLTKFAGTQTLSETQMKSFVELYIAYFNRAPDAVGLNFWGTAFATGTTLESMATLFIDQTETRATYDASLSNANFVTAVYSNVLGRVGDQGGIDFWLGNLENGSVGRDQFILGVLGGAKVPIAGASAEIAAQQAADQKFLSDKTDIGTYYAVTNGMSNVDNAKAAMAMFDGTQGSITNAVTAIDGFHTSAMDASNGEFLMTLVGVLDNPFDAAMAA